MKNSLKKKTNKKGFTLVELIMVVALIAVLAAIAVPTVTNVITTANENVDKSNAQTIELTLKTADAEIKAKTVTSLAADSKVSAVLAYYGVNISLTDKTKSDKYFAYKNKTVQLASASNSTDPQVFSADTTLANFLS